MDIDRKFAINAMAHGSKKVYTENNAVLFLAKDRAFLATLPEYRRQCELLGCDENQLRAVDLLIKRVTQYQEDNETKIPDVDPKKEYRALLE